MREKYEELQCEVVIFEKTDVIGTSSDHDGIFIPEELSK